MSKHLIQTYPCTEWREKVPAKFGEGSSVMAVGLCIGCMQEFFCTTLYVHKQADERTKHVIKKKMD